MDALDIVPIYEFESGNTTPLHYQAVGHVDKLDFNSELVLQYDRCAKTHSCIRYAWQRKVPSGLKGRSILVELTKPGYGAYPITIIVYEETEEV